MRAANGSLVIIVGLLLLWLAVSGRMGPVWAAFLGAASGEDPADPGMGGNGNGAAPVIPNVPVIHVPTVGGAGVPLPGAMEGFTEWREGFHPRTLHTPSWLAWMWREPDGLEPPDMDPLP